MSKDSLEERIRKIRLKNEEILRRHKEVEADKKLAAETNALVQLRSSFVSSAVHSAGKLKQAKLCNPQFHKEENREVTDKLACSSTKMPERKYYAATNTSAVETDVGCKSVQNSECVKDPLNRNGGAHFSLAAEDRGIYSQYTPINCLSWQICPSHGATTSDVTATGGRDDDVHDCNSETFVFNAARDQRISPDGSDQPTGEFMFQGQDSSPDFDTPNSRESKEHYFHSRKHMSQCGEMRAMKTGGWHVGMTTPSPNWRACRTGLSRGTHIWHNGIPIIRAMTVDIQFTNCSAPSYATVEAIDIFRDRKVVQLASVDILNTNNFLLPSKKNSSDESTNKNRTRAGVPTSGRAFCRGNRHLQRTGCGK